ncbi:MAG: helix-hairpin-helix domain-containing protein [Coriobacteriia bacterium]
MSYTTSNDPLVQSKLTNRWWRWINSLWVLPPILSLGFLGWAGFMIAAIRTGQRKYWVSCGIYAGTLVVWIALITPAPLLAILPFLGCWIVPTIHAIVWNREYLRTLAAKEAKGAWFEAPETAAVRVPAQQGSGQFGVSNQEFYATSASTGPSVSQNPAPAPAAPPIEPVPVWIHSPSSPIDINSVTVEALNGEPIDPVLARRLIDVRDARGGFRDFDDLVQTTSLKPHEAARIRGMFVFGESKSAPAGHGDSGRILDI